MYSTTFVSCHQLLVCYRGTPCIHVNSKEQDHHLLEQIVAEQLTLLPHKNSITLQTTTQHIITHSIIKFIINTCHYKLKQVHQPTIPSFHSVQSSDHSFVMYSGRNIVVSMQLFYTSWNILSCPSLCRVVLMGFHRKQSTELSYSLP